MASTSLLSCLLLLTLLFQASLAQLQSNFYSQTCPQAESIVSSAVQQAISNDPTLAGPLLRLHFHDCFVRGCDGSVLLEAINGVAAEKDASINFSLAAFNIIDNIKAQLEGACPGTVSCADILALVARDAVKTAGGPWIPMRTGRRDGFTSRASETGSLPSFTDISGLIDTFSAVGLDTTDMVTLSGAHTVGKGHCTSLTGRLRPNDDGLIDEVFRSNLTRKCFRKSRLVPMQPVVMDFLTPNTFDNQYYKNLQIRRGLFITDSSLTVDSRTSALVDLYAANQTEFFVQFVKSMLSMSEISVITGGRGEVRFDCHFTNQY